MSPPRRRRPRRPGDDVLKRVAVVWLAGAALVAAVAGCGGGNKQPTTTPEHGTTVVRIYFLLHGKLQPISRVVSSDQPWVGAWENLKAGPTGETPLNVLSAGPMGVGESLKGSSVDRSGDGVLTLNTRAEVPRAFIGQAVYTLSQFAPGRPVNVNGKRYTRKDFEDMTPIILVESPLPEQKVKSPLHATGTANTFEATFQYDLVGPDGKLLKTHFVTATSGTGTRGTFDFTVPFTVDRDGMGKLVVYELSAEDGSRIHEVEIPIRLAR